MFSVSGRTSTNFSVAPRSRKALAVETNVYEGRMTSSPGATSHSSAAISSADVHDVVSRTRAAPKRCSISCWHSRVNGPSPLVWPLARQRATSSASSPAEERLIEGDAIAHADTTARSPTAPGKRNPSATYRLNTGTLCEEMLVLTVCAPSA